MRQSLHATVFVAAISSLAVLFLPGCGLSSPEEAAVGYAKKVSQLTTLESVENEFQTVIDAQRELRQKLRAIYDENPQFSINGQIKEMTERKLSLWGRAFPVSSPDGSNPNESSSKKGQAALIFGVHTRDPANLVIEHYNQKGIVASAKNYTGLHYFIERVSGTNAFGMEVPVFVYGKAPKDVETSIRQLTEEQARWDKRRELLVNRRDAIQTASELAKKENELKKPESGGEPVDLKSNQPEVITSVSGASVGAGRKTPTDGGLSRSEAESNPTRRDPITKNKPIETSIAKDDEKRREEAAAREQAEQEKRSREENQIRKESSMRLPRDSTWRELPSESHAILEKYETQSYYKAIALAVDGDRWAFGQSYMASSQDKASSLAIERCQSDAVKKGVSMWQCKLYALGNIPSR